MAVSESFSMLRSIYVNNNPMQYPMEITDQGGYRERTQPCYRQYSVPTGWQVLPNILWGHFLSPKDWFEMTIKYEAVRVKSMTGTLFNMIPLQTQLAIQGTTTFTTFNNTIYMMGYKDELYETPPFDWLQERNSSKSNELIQGMRWNPVFKEGAIVECNEGTTGVQVNWWQKGKFGTGDESTSTTKIRQTLPEYIYTNFFNQGAIEQNAGDTTKFSWYSGRQTGAFWDPLNRPGSIQELRPGKNAMQFSWEAAEADSGRWWNLDTLAYLWPYTREQSFSEYKGMANTGEYPFWVGGGVDPPDLGSFKTISQYPFARIYSNIPNWRYIPVVPTSWFLKEIEESNLNVDLRQKMFLTANPGGGSSQPNYFWMSPVGSFKPGTEYEMFKYPPTQWFIKMIPLWDDKNNLISLETQCWYKLTLHLECKPRKSALYAPTWGPIPNNIWQADEQVQFSLPTIRGRSGGARRTWLNRDNPSEVAAIPATTANPDNNTQFTAPVCVTPQYVMKPVFLGRSTQSGTAGVASTVTTWVDSKVKKAIAKKKGYEELEEDSESSFDMGD